MGKVQFEVALALSVVVRWGPVRTAVNGTVVARPVRTDHARTRRLWDHPACRARPVPGDDLPRWQAAEGGAAAGVTPSVRAGAGWWWRPAAEGRVWLVSWDNAALRHQTW
jgi:hypothetical protein